MSEAESSWNYGHLINVLLINPVNVLQEFPATTGWIVKPLVNRHNPSMLWSDYFSYRLKVNYYFSCNILHADSPKKIY